jgi:hypothetical protein
MTVEDRVGTRAALVRAFIIFVDAMFTTLLQARFTNAFNVALRFQAHACVWRTGRGD